MPFLPRDDEARRLLEMTSGPGQWERLHALLSDMMTVLQHRAQVLLTLCGAVVTVTGFSGRAIAGTSFPAQFLVIAGLALIVGSAAFGVFGVLPVRWLSQQPGQGLPAWLAACLAYRDRKTSAYRASMALLLAGIALYGAAIALMLLHP